MMNKPWIANKPWIGNKPIDKIFSKHKISTELKGGKNALSWIGIEENSFSESEVEESSPTTSIVKIPVVLAERTIQVVVEANISLDPLAIEIKRVLKNVVLTHCKLVPVAFTSVPGTNYRRVTRAKLFVEGYIRNNIEYVADQCNGLLYSRIVNISFSRFLDLTAGDFIIQPLLVAFLDTTSYLINPKGGYLPQLDTNSFGNYNKQPYCELVRANFYEFDFSPCLTNLNESCSKLRKTIVLDLTLNILQVQQVQV
ncbi:CsxC family protein [Bacillus pseudomycoides]|uniref:CsxC family protein n=1 Tax=Bacillus pseudomycoides TaxID=64104 RepID=UPI0028D6AC25|nr:Uracil permease [Bacillus pseudomycoides]